MIDGALVEYEVHNFPEARALFLQAHTVFPNARTLRGLGMVAFELKTYQESVQRLEAALASPVKQLEGELRAQTEELLARAKTFLARFTLRTAPPDIPKLQLSADGAPMPLAPDHSFRLAVGEHVLVLRAQGYLEATRALSVQGGEERELLFELQKSKPASAPAAALKPTSEKPPLYKNPWLWTGVGALIVGGVVAGVVIAMRNKDKSGGANPDFSDDFGGPLQTLRLPR